MTTLNLSSLTAPATYSSKQKAIAAYRRTDANAQHGVDFEVLEFEGKFWCAPKGARKEATEYVALATENEDLGLVHIDTAHATAQEAANEMGATVTIRNIPSDVVIDIVNPTTTESTSEEHTEMETISETVAEVEAPAPEEAAPVGAETPKARDFKAEIADLKEQAKNMATYFKGQIEKVEADWTAAKEAAKAAREAGKPVKSPAAKGPTGKTAECIALALRPEGVTVAELVALTNWKGAPWSWNFMNPQGTGWATRFGYDFKSEKGEDGKVRYFLGRTSE